MKYNDLIIFKSRIATDICSCWLSGVELVALIDSYFVKRLRQ